MGQKAFFQIMALADCVRLLEDCPALPAEDCPLEEASGRFLAHDCTAPEDLPRTARACMDGYALRAQDSFGATENNAALLECIARIPVNGVANCRLETGQCAAVFTGSSLPEGADAVLMWEHCREHPHGDGHARGAGQLSIAAHKALSPHSHVVYAGDDVCAGARVLPAQSPLNAAQIGLLAALGMDTVPVYRRPRVAILASGDEIVPVRASPAPGQIRDSNSVMLAVSARTAGALPTFHGIVPDNPDLLARELEQTASPTTGLPPDCIVLTGGSSLGARDYTLSALEKIGARILCHGLAMRPGKPLILAQRDSRHGTQYFWGLPGQVSSAHTCMQILVRPFLEHLAGKARAFDQSLWPHCMARLARNIASAHGREDYIRVSLHHENDGLLASPVHAPSGLFRSLLHSQGLLHIPALSEGLEAGVEVRILLM